MRAFLLWLVALLSSFDHAAAPQKDYIGLAAAEVAYSALLTHGAPPVKPKVPRSKCTKCGGTGRVRSGDDQGWTKCPDCEPDPAAPSAQPVLKSTAPGQGWPARTTPAAGG